MPCRTHTLLLISDHFFVLCSSFSQAVQAYSLNAKKNAHLPTHPPTVKSILSMASADNFITCIQYSNMWNTDTIWNSQHSLICTKNPFFFILICIVRHIFQLFIFCNVRDNRIKDKYIDTITTHPNVYHVGYHMPFIRKIGNLLLATSILA